MTPNSRNLLVRSTLIAGLLSGALLLANCGGDDDDQNESAAPTTAGSVTAASAPATTAPKAGEAKVGSLSITGGGVRETTNDVTAAYMTIKNGGEADRLVKATTQISTMVQVHETVMVNNAMQMQEIQGGLGIPAGGEVLLKPGGYHVMIMNLKSPLKPGDMVTLELTFEKAGKVTIVLPVKSSADLSSGTGGMSGGGMGMATPTKAP